MKNNNTNNGIGFIGLLTIAFIVLKLCKIIKWSWVWVLCPIWLYILVMFVALLIFVLIKVLK